MAFLETPSFDPAMSNGAINGPKFNTVVITVDSGAEARNSAWAVPLHSFDVTHGLKTQAQLDALKAFYMYVSGRLGGFRFKDWTDYTVDISTGVFLPITGSTTTLQLAKLYPVGSGGVQRVIKKPVVGTVAFSGSGVYTLDTTTGIVTIVSGSAPIAWSGQFDVPCRFDTDVMQATIDSFGNFSWNQILIVELRNP